MTSARNAFLSAISAAILLAVASPSALFAQPADGSMGAASSPPSDVPLDTTPVKRDFKTIMGDVSGEVKVMRKVLPSFKLLADPEARAKIAPAATPVLWNLVNLFGEAAAAEPRAKPSMDANRYQLLGVLSTLDDAKATKQLADEAASPDPKTALAAQLTQLTTSWMKSKGSADVQSKILDQVEAMVKKNPTSNTPVGALEQMSELGATTPELSERAQAIVVNDSTSVAAKKVKAELEAGKILAANENKPLVIKGKTPEGKEFTTADWKGKVILVDFWATWCGPCKAELPRVKQIYSENHDKGLELLGVSNDYDLDALKTFTVDEKMPWPEIFDADAAAQHQWNPVTLGFGIRGIPTMFLIDKNGICRTVEARDKMEDLIPKLLAEVPVAAGK